MDRLGVLLLGFAGLVGVFVATIPGNVDDITQDVRQQTAKALTTAGLGEVEIAVSGRQVVLSGEVSSPDQKAEAERLIETYAGVRSVENQIRVVVLSRSIAEAPPPPVQNPYVFEAHKDADGRVTLAGHVPDDIVRGELVGRAQNLFAGSEVVDGLTLASGMPDTVWAGVAVTGLEQLAKLDTARARLSGRLLSLEGDAPSREVAQQLTNALTAAVPDGYYSRTDLSAPLPVASPFKFRATKTEDGQVMLTGFAPDADVRREIMASARRALGSDKIAGKLELATGQPDTNWPAFATSGLDELASLTGGNWQVTDRQGVLTGAAMSIESRSDIQASLGVAVPDGYQLLSDLTAPLPVADPYRISAVRGEGGRVELSGVMPGTEAREDYVARAAEVFGAGNVGDNIAIARTVPDANWTGFAGFALGALGRMNDGSAVLTDHQLQLTGKVDDAETLANLGRFVGLGTPQGYTVETDLTLPPPPLVNPFRVSALRGANGRIALSGVMPSEAAKADYIARAGEVFGAGNVDDQITIARTVPDENWVGYAGFALGALGRMYDGYAILTGRQLLLFGKVPDTATADEIKQLVRLGTPQGYSVETGLIPPPPPLADPYRVSALRSDDGRVELSGAMPSEEAKADYVARAGEVFGAGNVDDMTTIARTVPDENWVGYAGFALGALGRLDDGYAILTDRQLLLFGKVADSETAQEIDRLVQLGTPQGYSVETSLTVLPPPLVDPYRVSALRSDDGRVELSGAMPSEEAKADYVARAGEVFGAGNVDDMTTIARTVPDEDWVGYAGFALGALGRMDDGYAILTGRQLQLFGKVPDTATADEIKQLVRLGTPQGYSVVTGLTPPPPLADPYRVSALRSDDGRVALSGAMPSEEAKADYVARAGEVFGAGNVDDMTTIARTVPDENWVGYAGFALGALGRLDDGYAILTDRHLLLFGKVPDTATADEIKQLVRLGTPQGYSVETGLTPPPPLVDPYRVSALRGQGGRVELSGAMPSEEAKADYVARAGEVFGAGNVDDMTTIARTVPDEDWVGYAGFALGALGRMDDGYAILTGRHLLLFGKVPDTATADEIKQLVRLGTPQGYSVETGLTPPPPLADPYRVSALRRDDGRVELSGAMPSEEAKADYVARAGEVFGAGNVDDMTTIARTVPDENWVGYAGFALGALGRMDDGYAILTDRHLQLFGKVPDTATADEIKQLVRLGTPQGYSVETGLTPPPPPLADPYRVSALRSDDGRVALSGVMSSEEARADYVARAGEVFGADNVDDMITIARTVPDEKWAGYAGFALGTLGRLDDGYAILTDRHLLLFGKVPDTATADEIKQLVRLGTPQGYSVETGLTPPPPLADPYRVSALRSDDGRVELSGAMPSEEAKADYVARAGEVFGAGNVDDMTTIARTVPDEKWARYAGFALGALGRLDDGYAILTDRHLQLFGKVPDTATADEIKQLVRLGTPQGYSVETGLTPPPPLADPYRVSALRSDDGRVELSGAMPSEEAKADYVARAGEVFGAGNVDDMTTIARTVPDEDWVGYAGFALGALGRMDDGYAILTGRQLLLFGKVPDTATADEIKQLVRLGTPQGYSVETGLTPPPPPLADPYRVSALRSDDGRVELSGAMPSEAAKADYVARAVEVFGTGNVKDGITIARTVPDENWVGYAGFALGVLGRLDDGYAILTGRQLLLFGKVPDTATADEIKQLVRLGTPQGYSVETGLTPPPPPLADPYRVSALRSDDGRVELSGAMPSEEAKADYVARAGEVFGAGNVDDMTTIARTVPDENWVGYAGFALGTLGRLDDGYAILTGRQLQLFGKVPDTATADEIKQLVRLGTPQGYSVETGLTPPPPPLADPYRVSALRSDDGRVELSGAMPSEEAKADYVARAGEVFGAGNVDDMTTIARTVPDENWVGYAGFALGTLGRLDDGYAILTDRHLQLFGKVADSETAQEIDRLVQLGTPQGYSVETSLTVLPPPLVDPYRVSALRGQGGRIELSGMMPSEAAKADYVARAVEVFGTGNVKDGITIARTVPDENWVGYAGFALGALGRLDDGYAILTGRQLLLFGKVPDTATADEIKQLVRLGTPQGYSVETGLTPPPPPLADPYRVSALRSDDGRVALSGVMPSEEARADYVARAGEVFGAGNVDDMTTIARTVPDENWVGYAGFALGTLGRLDDGYAILTDRQLLLFGKVADSEIAQEIDRLVRLGTPQGYTAGTGLTAPLPPLASPYGLTATKGAGGALVLAGHAPDEETRQALVADAIDVFGDGVVDQLTLASGMPADGWPAFAMSGFDELFDLADGSWEVTGTSGTLTGQAPSLNLVSNVRARLREGVPAGFTVSDVISVPVPGLAPKIRFSSALPLADPYRFVAEKGENGKVVLTGSAPGEDTRTQIIQAATQAFGSGAVDDRLSLARGTPDDAWPGFAVSAFDELAVLEQGSWAVTGQLGQLVGNASSSEDKNDVEDSLQIGVPESYLVSSRIDASVRMSSLEGAVATILQTAAAATPEVPVPTAESSVTLTTPEPVVSEPVAEPVPVRTVCRTNLDNYIVNQRILFDTDRVNIRPDGQKVLTAVATLLKGCPTVNVEIAGHADARGSDDYNLALSQRRAESVRTALIARQIEDGRLLAVGYGESRPVADNTTQAGLARNRRIEFAVQHNDNATPAR